MADLFKNSRNCDILPCPISCEIVLTSSILKPWYCETSHWKEQIEFEVSQKGHARRICLFDMSGNFLEKLHLQGLSLFDLTQNTLSGRSSIPVVLVKNNQKNYLTLWNNCLSLRYQLEQRISYPNRLKGRSGNYMFIEGFEKLQHIPEYL